MTRQAPTLDPSARADEAARSVVHRFGHRFLFLPGTHLAATTWSSKRIRSLGAPWHYWWQAHYLDCLADAGLRELERGATPQNRFDGARSASAGRLASRLLIGVRLRNLLTFVNDYFDDMAWLALAAQRLDQLAVEAGKPGHRRYTKLHRRLTAQFISASTDDLGGGTFWSKVRDFKNTPATGPVALYFARTGQREKAQSLVDWLDATLFDARQGLYLDGARLTGDGRVVVEENVYTYNQGPVLGALLELGGPGNLKRAEEIIFGIERHLTVGAAGSHVLRCEGVHDRGLFTGILCRYLALAARDQRLTDAPRSAARRLVLDTAEAFWQGSRIPPLETEDRIFAIHATGRAELDYPAGTAVELSTQLQAWMTLEAAATLRQAVRPTRDN